MGGEDLKFPHHDNEIAQTEAYFNSKQWVNYFFHTGHLHIDGLKMSKSLKNFISIRDALAKFTPRQLRLMVLLQPWNKVMNFTEGFMNNDVKSKEKSLVEFFIAVKNLLRTKEGLGLKGEQHWNEKDRQLNSLLLQKQDAIHKCMCNNFDTPGVFSHIMALVKSTNDYIHPVNSQALLIRKIATFITRILTVFGLNGGLFIC